jgi:hypothetical protein
MKVQAQASKVLTNQPKPNAPMRQLETRELCQVVGGTMHIVTLGPKKP